MKRTRIASIILAIAMLVSVMSVGFGASAVDASSTMGSSLTNVKLDGSKITGNFNIWGWLDKITAYVGQGTSGAVAGTYTNPAGDWTTNGTFTINLNDGGASTSGYTVVMANTSASDSVSAYIPYEGPSYLMEIRRNGSAVTSLDLGLNEGVASGFSFVYENGGSYTYNVDKTDIITVAKSGDTFTITPKKIGTAKITATCNGVSTATLTVNVVDDSTLTAQWYDTGAAIANNATFSGQATVTYGFGVEAYPDNYTVSLSNNTANAKYSTSSVQGQYPNSIVAANEGSVKVTITGATKTIAFTVNFTAAPEPVFGFYTDSACKTEAEPMVAIEAGKSATIYTNEAVASWTVEGTGASKSASTSTSITITAATVDSLVTVSALDAKGNVLGWFDVYVTTGSTTPVVPASDVYVFKINKTDVLYANASLALPSNMPAVIESSSKRTFAPLRAVAFAAGVNDMVYNDADQSITFTGFDGYKISLKVGSTDCVLTKGGSTINLTLSSKPYIDNKTTMLPLRDITVLVGGQVEYVEKDSNNQYIVVSPASFDVKDAGTYTNAYDTVVGK